MLHRKRRGAPPQSMLLICTSITYLLHIILAHGLRAMVVKLGRIDGGMVRYPDKFIIPIFVA